MGAWGTICTFDHARYVAVVEPAILAIDGIDHEALCDLHEDLVTRHCMTTYAWIGRNYSPQETFGYADDNGETVLGMTPAIYTFVEALDERWRSWTHGSGGYGEGLTGWLDVDETARFAAALPSIRATPGSGDEEGTADRLDRIRILIAHATERQLGVLWGRDLKVVYDRGVVPVPRLVPLD